MMLDVVPVVVNTDDAAVSTDSGVSVFVAVYNVTPQRYAPAAIVPPVGSIVTPVPVVFDAV